MKETLETIMSVGGSFNDEATQGGDWIVRKRKRNWGEDRNLTIGSKHRGGNRGRPLTPRKAKRK